MILTKYMLLLKRLFKKKSYIVMLAIVPLMVLALKGVSRGDAGLMKIGVYVPGEDYASSALKESIETEPGSFRYIFYDDSDKLIADVKSQKLSEGWVCPDNLDEAVENIVASGQTDEKIEIIIREQGLSHLLGREVLNSRVYESLARQMASTYIANKLYKGNPTEEQQEKILKTFDGYEINGNLFELGYLDDSQNQNSDDTNYIMMPLRGILALWLLTLSIAASMYYLEDEKNGLFIWWKPRFGLIRDFLYYIVIMAIPTIMVLVGLRFGGVSTSLHREILSITIYDFVLICLANILREIIGTIKGLGIITPVLIMASALLSPVFVDFKEGRILQNLCPTFHYLNSINDAYYLKTLILFGITLLLIHSIVRLIIRR
ncbi:MAG: ABC transporter permease [Pseudobutyrivibrio sp.]|nr:ABC transporter permease [Pseudobutyrivibrio sp.]